MGRGGGAYGFRADFGVELAQVRGTGCEWFGVALGLVAERCQKRRRPLAGSRRKPVAPVPRAGPAAEPTRCRTAPEKA